jgi:hypothetical protein
VGSCVHCLNSDWVRLCLGLVGSVDSLLEFGLGSPLLGFEMWVRGFIA